MQTGQATFQGLYILKLVPVLDHLKHAYRIYQHKEILFRIKKLTSKLYSTVQ